MSISPDVIALMQASEGEYQQAERSLGTGLTGDRPPAGVHDVDLVGMDIAKNTRKGVKINEAGQQADVEVITFTFSYQRIKDPNQPNNPVDFKGSPIDILPNYKARIQGEKAQTRWKINTERLAGFLSTLTGVPNSDASMSAQVGVIQKHLAEGKTYHLRLRVNVRDWNSPEVKDAAGNITKKASSGTSWEDYASELISA